MAQPRTDNDFLIGSNGQTISPMMSVVITTKQQAFRTAAWLKVMACLLPDEEEASTFEEIEEAVMNT